MLTILQWTTTTSVVFRIFTMFISGYFFLVFPSNFKKSSWCNFKKSSRCNSGCNFKKSSRCNSKCNSVFYFAFIYFYWRIITKNTSCFWWHTQDNLEYLTQSMNHHVIEIYHSALELIFLIHCFCITFYIFPCIEYAKTW